MPKGFQNGFAGFPAVRSSKVFDVCALIVVNRQTLMGEHLEIDLADDQRSLDLSGDAQGGVGGRRGLPAR
jgi:hypothetical protein